MIDISKNNYTVAYNGNGELYLRYYDEENKMNVNLFCNQDGNSGTEDFINALKEVYLKQLFNIEV